MTQDTFLIVGPGIISGPWSAEDALDAWTFMDDIGAHYRTPHYDPSVSMHWDTVAAREALRVHAGITVS